MRNLLYVLLAAVFCSCGFLRKTSSSSSAESHLRVNESGQASSKSSSDSTGASRAAASSTRRQDSTGAVDLLVEFENPDSSAVGDTATAPIEIINTPAGLELRTGGRIVKSINYKAKSTISKKETVDSSRSDSANVMKKAADNSSAQSSIQQDVKAKAAASASTSWRPPWYLYVIAGLFIVGAITYRSWKKKIAKAQSAISTILPYSNPNDQV